MKTAHCLVLGALAVPLFFAGCTGNAANGLPLLRGL
jgi:hypothetical protein